MEKIGHGTSQQGDRPLNYSQTIEQHLVHKSSIHEVFITDTRTTDAGLFLAAAQFPRQHTLYSDRIRNAYDPLLVAEVGRQATIAMAHRYFDVPIGWPLLAYKVEIKVLERELLIIDKQPANILVSIQVQKIVNKEMLMEAILMHTISLGRKIVAHMQVELKGMPKNMYTYMREINKNNKDLRDLFDYADVKELEPSSLGRHDRRNVVINDSFDHEGRIYPVKIDSNHPGLFDHEVDHISGAVLGEVCRQASFRHFTQKISAQENKKFADWEISRFEMDFIEFAEFGTPIYCRITAADLSRQGAEAAITLEIIQGSAMLGRARVLWACE